MTLTQYLSTLYFDAFVASISVYTAALFFEVLKKGSVVNYINLTSVLIVCLISGGLAAAFPPPHSRSQGWIAVAWSVCGAGVVALLVYRLSASFEEWRIFFAVIAAVSVCIPAFLPKQQTL